MKLLCCLVGTVACFAGLCATPVPIDREREAVARTYGRVVLPDPSVKLFLEPDGTLGVSLPSDHVSLEADSLATSKKCFRTVQEVEGDFSLRVRVLLTSPPAETAHWVLYAGIRVEDAGKPANGALEVGQDYRIDTKINPAGSVKTINKCLLLRVHRPEHAGSASVGLDYSDNPVCLELSRKGQTLRARYCLDSSGADREWVELWERKCILPGKLAVGLFAAHGGGSESFVTFDKYIRIK